jgi:hypothetical protein
MNTGRTPPIKGTRFYLELEPEERKELFWRNVSRNAVWAVFILVSVGTALIVIVVAVLFGFVLAWLLCRCCCSFCLFVVPIAALCALFHSFFAVGIGGYRYELERQRITGLKFQELPFFDPAPKAKT